MKGYMLILPAILKLEDELVAREFDAPIPLDVLQEAVGGSIETVPYFNCLMYEDEEVQGVAFCNEEGKINGLPVNPGATNVWLASIGRTIDDSEVGDVATEFDVLVGDVAFVWGDEEFMDAL